MPENLSPLWVLPAVLLIITVLLALYWLILSVAPVRSPQDAKAAPSSPTPMQPVQTPVVLNPAPMQNPYTSQPPAYPSQPPAYGSVPPGYATSAPGYASAPPGYPPQPQMGYPPPAGPVTGVGSITVIAGAAPQEIPLPAPQFALGRFYAADQGVLVGLDDKSISRRHAVMRANPATREYYLQDVGSTYGTVLLAEGRMDKLTPNVETRLYNGDIVQLGNAVRLRFNLPGEMRSSATQL